MKTFKITLTLVIALFFASTTFAKVPSELERNLRVTVATWLQAPDLQERGIDATTVYLKFTINEKNELVIKEIDTAEEFLIPFILERLQGKKIKKKMDDPETVYNITVSFVAEK